MALQKVTRRSVPDEVFEQLLSEVMGGGLGPGEALPSERRLSEVLGVSRPAVREALQRLSHAGLVEVRQGDTTTVRDFRRSGGLDLLPSLLVPNGEVDLKVARSILEARLHVGPKIAELAASRGPKMLGAELDKSVAALEADDDPVERQRRAVEFWQLLVDGADSITFRLMFNSMLAAYEPALEALAVVMSAEVEQVSAYAALAAAVSDRKPELARSRAEELLSHATNSLIAAIDALEEA
jgi:GntR family transcriptional repressor for pyruvate dehydrogenase complex